jgi:hypothetical protein
LSKAEKSQILDVLLTGLRDPRYGSEKTVKFSKSSFKRNPKKLEKTVKVPVVEQRSKYRST